ncbi:CG3618 [Drosophila busckii]|uniref:CG3618 n=2 Tax=Drosophila busckii TaxID=30019 RepID=A0A0M5IYH9_DROBS|nr:CG3618 [Drosophila busckii]
MQHTFRSVMLSDLGSSDVGVGSGTNINLEFNNFNGDYDNSADNVAILGSQAEQPSKRMPMSRMRRCCFIASLLLCVIAVVVFVWLIPCGNPDGTGVCPALVDRAKARNWLKYYSNIEILGKIHVVSGLRSWEKNLIFLYRGDAFFPGHEPHKDKSNGILCVIGSTGAIAWYDELEDEPIAMDCSLLDVDMQGKPDCLVMDEYGTLGAINSASGEWRWRFKERAVRVLREQDFPLILPDVDGDGVLDLLYLTGMHLEERTKSLVKGTANASSLESRNVLHLLSGRQGKPLGDSFAVNDCWLVSKLSLDADKLIVNFNCWNNRTQQDEQRSKSVAELYALITNKSIVGQRLQVSANKLRSNPQHRPQRYLERNVYVLNGRELTVENHGKCPACDVTFVLTEQRDGRTHILQNSTTINSYGMIPAKWSFTYLQTKLTGFVIKFWKYHNVIRYPPGYSMNSNKNNVDKIYNYTNSSGKSSTSGKKKDSGKARSQQQLLHSMPIQKREVYNVPSKNQSKNSNSEQALLLKSYKMQLVTESVILVIFIGADTRIENTSQSNIVQFCRTGTKELFCLPDLHNQQDSMVLADLDQDHDLELVTYTSTFAQDNNDPAEDWKLTTYVRLLRLESELPAHALDLLK